VKVVNDLDTKSIEEEDNEEKCQNNSVVAQPTVHPLNQDSNDTEANENDENNIQCQPNPKQAQVSLKR